MAETRIVVPDSLNNIITGSGLAADTAREIVTAYSPIIDEYGRVFEDVDAMPDITEASQLTEMKQARTLRLTLKDIRVRAEKAKVTLKADALKIGKCIDLVFNHVKGEIEQREAWLLAQEQFAERAEAARVEKVRAERTALLDSLGVDGSFVDLGRMPEAQWATYLKTCQTQHAEAQAAAAKAEQDRIAAELEREQREAELARENERLRKEKEEADKKAKADRDAAAARIKAEQAKADAEKREADAARQQLELQRQAEGAKIAKAKADAEAKAAKDKAAADQKRQAEIKAAQESEAKAREMGAELRAALGLVLENGVEQKDGSVIVTLSRDDAALIAATFRKAGGV